MSRRFDRVSRHTASSDEFLATPEEAEIYVVDTVQQLAFLSRELDETLKADGEGGATTPMVGLDAEWNPYVGKSKASILQVAFQKAVYILDLDTLSHPDSVHRLIAHLNMIFGNERLMKIGELMRLDRCFKWIRLRSTLSCGQDGPCSAFVGLCLGPI
jgi:hypothetical protein